MQPNCQDEAYPSVAHCVIRSLMNVIGPNLLLKVLLAVHVGLYVMPELLHDCGERS